MASGSPLLIAGLSDTWNVDDTAVVITTTANPLMTSIHDRITVIIAPELPAEWTFGPQP